MCAGLVIALTLVWLASMGLSWPWLLFIGIVLAALAGFIFFKDQMAVVIGAITGFFYGLYATVYNIFASVWNRLASFVEFFANVFKNPVYSIKRLFVNLANTVLDLIKSMAEAIDRVLHTDMSGGIQNLQNRMEDWLGEMPEDYKVTKRMEMKNIADYAQKGYQDGKKASNWVSDKITGLKDKISGMVKGQNEAPGGETLDIGTVDTVNSVKGDVSISEEDLRYMRDAARIRFVNKFTTLRPSVNATFGEDYIPVILDGRGEEFMVTLQALINGLIITYSDNIETVTPAMSMQTFGVQTMGGFKAGMQSMSAQTQPVLPAFLQRMIDRINGGGGSL